MKSRPYRPQVEQLEERDTPTVAPTPFGLYAPLLSPYNRHYCPPYLSDQLPDDPLDSTFYLQELYRVYHLDKLDTTRYPTNGRGQTIVMVEAYDHPDLPIDLLLFDNLMHLPPPAGLMIALLQGSPTSSPDTTSDQLKTAWNLEAALDVEWAHAVAPAANLVVLEAPTGLTSDLYDAVRYAVNLPYTNNLLLAFGLPENDPGVGPLSLYQSALTPPAGHIPMTVVVAAGNQLIPDVPAVLNSVLAVGESILINSKSRTAVITPNTGLGPSQLNPGRAVPDVFSEVGYFPVVETVPGGPILVPTGGTSAASVVWAGIVARLEQRYGALDLTRVIPYLPVRDFTPVQGALYGRGNPVVDWLLYDL
jgi:hypothetical protein